MCFIEAYLVLAPSDVKLVDMDFSELCTRAEEAHREADFYPHLCALIQIENDKAINQRAFYEAREARKEARKEAAAAERKRKREIVIDWPAVHAANLLDKQTTSDIKAFLRSKGLFLGGKKLDLVERAKVALESCTVAV